MRLMRCIGIFALSALGCGKPPEKPTNVTMDETAKVQVQELKHQTWHQTIRTFGVVEAAETVTISAEFSARVDDVYFSEGQDIEAGQTLVKFDIAEQKMRYKQAEGALVGARAKLEEARSLLKRREELFAQKAISKEQLDIFRTTLVNSEAKYEQSLVGRSLAKHQLDRSRLTSPVTGKVVTKRIEPGETAMPGQPLAVIHVTDTMRVISYVTEQEINTIRVGAECTVTTPGVRGREYKAHVESWGLEADKLTGNFPVKLIVENSDGLLKAGMTASVTLKGIEVKDMLLIPDTAVVDRHRSRVVYRVRHGRAEEVAPVLALSAGDLLPVLHGLDVGDKLIVGGLDNVVDGTVVEIAGTIEMPVAAEPPTTTDGKESAMETAAQPSEVSAEMHEEDARKSARNKEVGR